MRLVGSYEEYTQVTKRIRFENNGFTADQIKTHIEDGRLWHKRMDARQILLFDEREFMQLILSKEIAEAETAMPTEVAMPSHTNCLFPEIEVPMVCFLVNEQTCKEQLEQWAFRFVCASDKYLLDLSEIEQGPFPDSFSICFQTKDHEEFLQVIKLWEDNLPKVELPVITYEDFRDLEKNRQMILVKDKKNDQIVGACYYDTFISISTIHHIVVSRDYRNQKLASTLIRTWLIQLAEKNLRKAVAWIEEDNRGSQKTFEKFGFVKSNIQSYQYIR